MSAAISTDAKGVLSFDELQGKIIIVPKAVSPPQNLEDKDNWIHILFVNNTQWPMTTDVPVTPEAGVFARTVEPPGQIDPFMLGSILTTGSSLAQGSIPYTLMVGTTPVIFTISWSTAPSPRAGIAAGTRNPEYVKTGWMCNFPFAPSTEYTGKDINNKDITFIFIWSIFVFNKRTFWITLEESLLKRSD